MTATPQIAVQITGKSDLGKIFGQTNKQLSAFQSHTQKTAAQIGKITSIGRSGFAMVDKSVTSLVRNTFQLFQNVSRIVDPLGIITGAATIAGLTALEAKFASLGLSQQNVARGLNMSITSLSKWQGAAKIAGFSAETATDGIRATEEAMAGAKLGQNQGAAQYLTQLLGPGWKKMDEQQILLAEAKKLQGLHGPALALAESNIGGALGQSQDFISFLAQGPAALQKQLAQAQKNGSMTGGQADVLGALAQGINSLEGAVEGFGTSVTATLAPDITGALGSITDWLDKNRPAITNDIKGLFTDAENYLKGVDWSGDWAKLKNAVKDVSDYLKGVDWKGDFDKFKSLIDEINTVVRAIGGWKPALEVLAGLFVVNKLAPVVAAFASMASAVASVGTGLAAIPLLFPAIAAAIAGAGLADMFLHGSTAADDNFDVSQKQMGTQTPAGVKANAAILRSTLKAHGMPDASIAGFFGNFIGESTMDPTRQQPDGEGYGIAQWGKDRQALFKQIEGVDIHGSTMAQQSDFVWKELNQPQNSALLASLMSGKLSPSQAALAIDTQYEKPANLFDPHSGIDQRSLFANSYYNGLQIGNGITAPKTTDDTPKTTDDTPKDGMYRSALTGKWTPFDGDDGADDHHVVVDVNIKHDRVLTKTSKTSPHVTAKIKTVTAFNGSTGWIGN
jgi:hypothetical protein